MSDIYPEKFKTKLARVAYEGYCAHTGNKSLVSGASLPPFYELKPEIQEAWAAAVTALGKACFPVQAALMDIHDLSISRNNQTVSKIHDICDDALTCP